MEDTGIMSIGNRHYSLTSDYTQWLQQWQKPFPLSIHIPPEACKIVTPLQPITWSRYLVTLSDQNLVTFFIDGITRGFRIGFDHSLVSLKSAKKIWKVHSRILQLLMTTSKLRSPLHVWQVGLRELCSKFYLLCYSEFPLKNLHYVYNYSFMLIIVIIILKFLYQ